MRRIAVGSDHSTVPYTGTVAVLSPFLVEIQSVYAKPCLSTHTLLPLDPNMVWIRSSLVVFQKHYKGLKVRQNSSENGVFQSLFIQ